MYTIRIYDVYTCSYKDTINPKKTSYEINNKVFGVLIKNIEQENNSFGVVNTNHTFLINGGL